MSQEEYRIYMGTRGWYHPDWREGFYPDDLPAEWALTYYANEFPVVALAAEDNWQASAEQLLADSHDRFRFLPQVPQAQLAAAEVRAALQVLDTRLLGVVVQLEQGAAPAGLENSLLALSPSPLCLDFGAGVTPDEAWQSFMQQHAVNPCLYANALAQGKPDVTLPGSLAVTFAPGEYDAKALRSVLEGVLRHERDDLCQALILTSANPSLETLRNAYLMVDLL